MDNKKVLAVVGQKEIVESDIDNLLNNLDSQTAMQFNSEQGRKQLLEELINQELIYLEALELGLDKEEDFLAEVEKMTQSLLKQYAINKLLSDASVDDTEIIDYYNENPEYFMEQESVRASHILVDDIDTAEKILEELNEGLSFDEAAQKYSKCPSKNRGGDLSYFTKGRMVPEFEKAAFELDINTLSEPVKTQFGYHIIKVTDKKEPSIIPFEQVKSQIKNQLIQQKQHKLYVDKIDTLKNRYDIVINQ